MASLVAILKLIMPHQGLSFPGLRPMNMSTFEVGKGHLADWDVHVRGPSIFFESPPGWLPGNQINGTARRVYEIARSDVRLAWELEPGEDFKALVNWSPEPRPQASPAPLAPPHAPSLGVDTQGDTAGTFTERRPNYALDAGVEEPDPGADDLPIVVKRGPGRPRKT